MRHYAAADRITKRVEEWGTGEMQFYPAIKELTLDLAADSFIGIPWGPEADRINRAFVDMVQASVAPVRKPLPFTQMKRGVDGRAFLVDYFTRETHRRRAEGGGQDMFSQFATAEYEDGSLMDDDAVVDHMNFLMILVHFTVWRPGFPPSAWDYAPTAAATSCGEAARCKKQCSSSCHQRSRGRCPRRSVHPART